jgi:hypothetical protein
LKIFIKINIKKQQSAPDRVAAAAFGPTSVTAVTTAMAATAQLVKMNLLYAPFDFNSFINYYTSLG